MEAKHTNLKAFVVREKCDFPSNFRNEMNLDDFLRQQGVVGIEGIDTRALTRVIREMCIRDRYSPVIHFVNFKIALLN